MDTVEHCTAIFCGFERYCGFEEAKEVYLLPYHTHGFLDVKSSDF